MAFDAISMAHYGVVFDKVAFPISIYGASRNEEFLSHFLLAGICTYSFSSYNHLIPSFSTSWALIHANPILMIA